MEDSGKHTGHWLEPGLQAHLSETVERAGCLLAVLGLLESQASRKTTGKAMVVSGTIGLTLSERKKYFPMISQGQDYTDQETTLFSLCVCQNNNSGTLGMRRTIKIVIELFLFESFNLISSG